MRTWRQLSLEQQREARDWWETHEAVYAAMNDKEALGSIFIEKPLPAPWPQPPVDLRGVKADQLRAHDCTAVVVPDSVYERLERGACFTDEDIETIRTEMTRFTGVPAEHFTVECGEFAEVILAVTD